MSAIQLRQLRLMSPVSCPVDHFPELEALPGVRAVFLGRCGTIDVATERDTAMARLAGVHRSTADTAGFFGMPFVTAEQVHGGSVAAIGPRGCLSGPSNPAGHEGDIERAGCDTNPAPLRGVDGLATATPGLCLAIYVADCAAIYLAAADGSAIALLHSGRAGTRHNIAGRGVETLADRFNCSPETLVATISPCIRPPHYEEDFAAEIATQLRACGVRAIYDSGTCTASRPDRYYSYRREKGRTGRMLALLAIKDFPFREAEF